MLPSLVLASGAALPAMVLAWSYPHGATRAALLRLPELQQRRGGALSSREAPHLYSGRAVILERSVLHSGAVRSTVLVDCEGVPARLSVTGAELEWDHRGRFREGDSIHAELKVVPLPQWPAPWSFDAHLLRQGISGTGEIREAHVEGNPLPPERLTSHVERLTTGMVESYGGSEVLAVDFASTIGEQSLLNDALRQMFLDTSLMHQMVVSGYQITLLWYLARSAAAKLLRFFPLSMAFTTADLPLSLFSAVLVTSYVHLLSDDVPSTRAWMALIVLCIGRSRGRGASGARSLFLLAYLLQLMFPGCLFELSFQLTFAALSGLLLGGAWGRERHPVFAWILLHCGPALTTLPVLLIWTRRLVPCAVLFNLIFGSLFSVLFICGGALSLLFAAASLPGAGVLVRVQLAAGSWFLACLRQSADAAAYLGLGPVELDAGIAALGSVFSGILVLFALARGFREADADETEFACYSSGPYGRTPSQDGQSYYPGL